MTIDLWRTVSSALLTASLCVLPAVPALAQSFPSKAVHIVLPYPPGGSGDRIGRPLARELSTLWGQPVVFENISGAGTIIGAEKVATSPPDGHTLLLTINPTVVGNRFLYKKLPYDPDKSLIPVTLIAQTASIVIAHPSFAANNLRELVEAARRAPGKVAYSSQGMGTSPQLVLEAIAQREGVRFLHVPYKGVAPATTAVVAGEVQVSLGSPAGTGAMVKAGKVKALAITSPRRSKQFPDVPTVTESGYPYSVYWIWFGLFAPAGTDRQLVARISRDVASVVKQPEFTDRFLTPFSLDPVANSPTEFVDVIRAEVASMAELVNAIGIRPE